MPVNNIKSQPAPKSPLFVAVVQSVLLLFFVYYIFIGGQTAQVIYDHHWRRITLYLTGGIIALWLLWRLWSNYKIPRTPFDWPLLWLLITCGLATLFSINGVYSQETTLFFIIYVCFFYMAADLGRWPWFIELAFNAIIGVSGLIWLLALVQFSRWSQNYTPPPPLLAGLQETGWSLPRLSVLGNPNTLASFIALILPIALYKLSASQKMITRLLLILWVVVLLSVALLTQSRGGLLGLIVAFICYLIFVSLPRQRSHKNSNPKAAGWFLVGLTIVTLITTFAWIILNLRTLGSGVEIRQRVMLGALEALYQNPLLGTGPGTLGEVLLQQQQQAEVIWPDAHNLFLTFIAETGLLGALGLIGLAIISVKVFWTGWRSEQIWPRSSLACVAALLGFTLHNLVDSQLKFPLIMILVAILAGFWLGPNLTIEPVAFFRPFQVIGAIVFIMVTTAFGIINVQHIEAYNRAVFLAYADWPSSVNFLKRASQQAPQMPFYQRQLAFALGYLAEQEQKPDYRAEAIEFYQSALTYQNKLPIDHANLSCLLWQQNQPQQAIQEITLALALEPDNLLYRFNLGYYRETLGQEDAAWLEYAQLIAARPDYLASNYWQQSTIRSKAIPTIVSQAAQYLQNDANPDPLKLINLYLQAGYIDQASQTYQHYQNLDIMTPAESHLAQGQILLASDELEAAKRAFETATTFRQADAFLQLSKIALNEDKLIAAKQNIEAALYLDKRPDILYQAGQIAAAQGDDNQAIQYYEAAFKHLTTEITPNFTRYATEVARRRPLTVGYLPCLKRIYPTNLLLNLTLAEAHLLEKQAKMEQATQLYNRLLIYEPEVRSRE